MFKESTSMPIASAASDESNVWSVVWDSDSGLITELFSREADAWRSVLASLAEESLIVPEQRQAIERLLEDRTGLEFSKSQQISSIVDKALEGTDTRINLQAHKTPLPATLFAATH